MPGWVTRKDEEHGITKRAAPQGLQSSRAACPHAACAVEPRDDAQGFSRRVWYFQTAGLSRVGSNSGRRAPARTVRRRRRKDLATAAGLQRPPAGYGVALRTHG